MHSYQNCMMVAWRNAKLWMLLKFKDHQSIFNEESYFNSWLSDYELSFEFRECRYHSNFPYVGNACTRKRFCGTCFCKSCQPIFWSLVGRTRNVTQFYALKETFINNKKQILIIENKTFAHHRYTFSVLSRLRPIHRIISRCLVWSLW